MKVLILKSCNFWGCSSLTSIKKSIEFSPSRIW